MPTASSPNTSSADSDAEHLRSLGKQLNENIELYLNSLSNSNIAPPNFRPGSGTSIPQDADGITAYHSITTLAERIIGLTSGPAGLYGISRQFFENSALQVAVELDLPEKVPLQGVVTAKQLAAETGADAVVVVRILRSLTPLFIFEETAPQTYRHTARSASLRDPSIKALVEFGGYDCFRAAVELPGQLKDTGYKNMTEPTKAAFCRAFGTDLGFFSYVYGEKPELGKRFSDAMAGTVKLSYEVGSCVDIYPFDTLTNGTIVDVGGGKGQAMHSIAARHPDLHFIVQDHSSVVTAGAQECPAELAPRFEWMGYDFFSPQQPVRGAAAYFFRHILHDWSDEYCVRILRPIVEAMLPGGASRLLICDMVVPEMNAGKAVAHRDLLMMAHLAGMERTERHFVELAKRVHPQLYLKKIWKSQSSPPGGARIMEFLLRT